MAAKTPCPAPHLLAELVFHQFHGEELPMELESAHQHAQDCAKCGGEAAQLRRTLDEAERHWPALHDSCACLDDNTLAAYADGALAKPESAEAERHLAQCDRCREALIELRELLEPEEVSPIAFVVSVTTRAIAFLKHPHTDFARLETAPLPVLGPESTASVCQWTQRFGTLTLHFTLARDEEGAASLDIAAEGLPQDADSRLTLCQNDQLIQSQPVSTAEPARFDHLPPGAYRFALEAGDASARFGLTLV